MLVLTPIPRWAQVTNLPNLNVLLANLIIFAQSLSVAPVLLVLLAIFQWDEFCPFARKVYTPRLLLKQNYDFIIIGGGSAGAVLASRLSEIPHWDILLLEAGLEENFYSDIPAVAGSLQLSPMDYKYQAEPQSTACLAFQGQRCNFPRGKVLGGTSVLNYMLYARGNKYDYDSWAAAGNPGWSYEDILPYFIKAEDNQNPEYGASRYHGTGGYLTVGEAPWLSPLGNVYMDAAKEMGYPVRDCNGANQTGFMTPQGTIRQGKRCSTAKAYLKPARRRSNLHVATGAGANKLLFEHGNSKRVIGVEFLRLGMVQQSYASKEVILSAGSFNSPQLLMLSGIGPKDHLAEVGVPLVHELPGVGQNLQDHIGYGGLIFTLEQPVAIMLKTSANLANALRYAKDSTGPFTSLGGVEGLGWVNTKYVEHDSKDYPDVQFIITTGSVVSDGGVQLRRNYGITNDVWNQWYEEINGKETWSIIPILLRPKARGSVRLRSANPKDTPVITANYLQNEEDVQVLIDGIRIALKFSEAKVFKQFGSRLYAKPLPACKDLQFGSDEYWECALRQITFTFYHFMGTCKMGPSSNPMAVINSDLKVHGIQGLRVVDGSVLPRVVSGNTNAGIIAVAEKASDLFKNAWL